MENEKKEFTIPNIEIVKFETTDILRTSVGGIRLPDDKW